MKFIDEYRDPDIVKALAEEIGRLATRPLRFMEVCGTHTMAIARWGLRRLLPANVELVSGPGCPVCVTSQEDLDRALALSEIPNSILATFGDMMRVPGSYTTLGQKRALGRDIRVVYSPLDALTWAEDSPEKKVIFLGVGFETTAPGVAATLKEAKRRGLNNFYVFSLHKTIPPALRALLSLGEVKLDGFIMPGHVSVIIGTNPYEFISHEYGLGSVIAGFEPIDIMQAIMMLARQVREGRPKVEIQYRRGVWPSGNKRAIEVMAEVFKPDVADWRGLGKLPGTGMALREQWASFDAGCLIRDPLPPVRVASGCRCGEVLRGVIRPVECSLFGKKCVPEAPLGPCMVSSEGSCAAAWKEVW